MRGPDASVSVVVTTHESPATLRLVLLALARQLRLPDEVVVADDGSAPETAAMLESLAPALPFPLACVWQPHDGFRAARSRNNAIFHASRAGAIAFLDQDTLPHRTWLDAHMRALRPGVVSLGHVLDLDDETARGLADGDVAGGAFETRHPESAERLLARLQRRGRTYAVLRRLGLGIKAKPRLRSCNFAARAADLWRVNGFDESYVGWGQEDDDLGRRLYAAGVRPAVLIDRARVSHLPHALRRAEAWGGGDNASRFARSPAARCEHGLDRHPHPDVRYAALPFAGRPAGAGDARANRL